MSEFSNAFWREFQYRIVDFVIYLAIQYPAISWIVLYVIGMPIIFFSAKIIKQSILMYKKCDNSRILKIDIAFLALCFAVCFFLIKFTIYKSDGYLIYFCIFGWISTFAVIIYALRPEKFTPNEPQRKQPKNQKGEKVKFDKPKNKLNLKNIKFKNNNKGSGNETK